MPVICSLCGYKGRTLGKLTAHRFKMHPEQAHKSLKKSIKGRTNGHLIDSLPTTKVEKEQLSARDILEVLKVKRDALNEVISIIEKVER